MVATGNGKILELSAYKEVIMLSLICCHGYCMVKVSLLMYDDNEQVRIQAAKLLWRLGNLLESK